MKKIFMISIVFSLLIIGGCTPNTSKENLNINIKGSCNMIEKSSHCMDFIGENWTNKSMKELCTDIGKFSEKECPKTELGGCKTGSDENETGIIWYYSNGGNQYSFENVLAPQKKCSSENGAQWIYQ